MDGRGRQLLILLAGIGAVVLATVIGRQDVMGPILEPPPVGRLLFGAAAVIVGVVLVMRAARSAIRCSALGGDPRALIRAVRLMFLAVAAFAAAAGWFLGSALPIVVALVIAGVDVIETTVLHAGRPRAPCDASEPERPPAMTDSDEGGPTPPARDSGVTARSLRGPPSAACAHAPAGLGQSSMAADARQRPGRSPDCSARHGPERAIEPGVHADRDEGAGRSSRP